jgi:hypothetical protein
MLLFSNIHLTSVSTISYAESNGGIFILIAPLGQAAITARHCKYKDKRAASDWSTIRTASDLPVYNTISLDFQRP